MFIEITNSNTGKKELVNVAQIIRVTHDGPPDHPARIELAVSKPNTLHEVRTRETFKELRAILNPIN